MIKTKGTRLVELKNSKFSTYFLDSILIYHNEVFDCRKIVQGFFNSEVTRYAVRSSSSSEDQEISNAGKFKTILNVEISDLQNAVNQVFDSYDQIDENSHVLIQQFLSQVESSGVIFTADPNTGSPYNILNYSTGTNTDLITSGKANGHLLVISDLCRNYPKSNSLPAADLIELCKEINLLLNAEHSDIEFAISNNKIYILQVRNLQIGSISVSSEEFKAVLESVHSKINEGSVAHPQLFGIGTIFSNMADWNPAELIGVRPKPLALSLFKELISDNIWAYERSNLGYRNLRSFPIAIELCGQPFVDVRVSFNSLLPQILEPRIGNELVNFYLSKLKSKPELHDKVEFEILITNYKENIDFHLGNIPIESSDRAIFRTSLVELTRNIIKSNPYGLENCLAKSLPLEDRFKEFAKSNLPAISKMYWLLEDCKRYGTLPFAGIARCAFIATDILESFKNSNLIEEEELELFYSSIYTIPSSIPYLVRKLSKVDFLARFGHLRPGTFEIENQTYAENYDNYFDSPSNFDRRQITPANFSENLAQGIKSSQLIKELNIEPFELLNFCKKAIQSRENVKFLFSQNISEVLAILTALGKLNGINREDLSFLNVQNLYNAYRESSFLQSSLNDSIVRGKQKFLETKSLWLPALISSSDQVLGFEVIQSQPNFITQEKATGKPVYIRTSKIDIDGKIVVIENADPGYDWIFSHNIIGLITAFGGANSHMAVRCKEMNIPAAIGVGMETLRYIVGQNYIVIDCRSKKIDALI